jgi:hypothetical protein
MADESYFTDEQKLAFKGEMDALAKQYGCECFSAILVRRTGEVYSEFIDAGQPGTDAGALLTLIALMEGRADFCRRWLIRCGMNPDDLNESVDVLKSGLVAIADGQYDLPGDDDV